MNPEPHSCSRLPRAARLPQPANVEWLARVMQVRPAALYCNALRCTGADVTTIRRAMEHLRLRLLLVRVAQMLPDFPWHNLGDCLVEFLDSAVLCRRSDHGGIEPVFEQWGGERLELWFWRGRARPAMNLARWANRGPWAAMLRGED
jgi:hypothetical protein